LRKNILTDNSGREKKIRRLQQASNILTKSDNVSGIQGTGGGNH
jgi:hypothetical protein